MINEEQEKFDERLEGPHDLKLIVDFESSDIEIKTNQMEIPDIKYKKRKTLKKEEVDLKKRNKNQNSLF